MQRVGIIGTGIMGADHAATLHRFVSGAEVSVLADLDLARARSVAEPLGARAVDDPRALISDPGVDAVIIASHDSTHADFVRACVEAGKPVLCEKPLAPTLDEAAAVLTDVGDGASLVSLGFMRRFDPGYTALRETIGSGALGAPVRVHSVGRGVTGGLGRTNENSVTNSAVHDLDIVPWLLGSPVVEAAWFAGRAAAGVDYADPQVILLRTADGTLTTVDIFLNAGYGYDVRCEVVGECGVATLAEPVRVVTDRDLKRSADYAADWRPRFAEAYRLELQAWVDAISGCGPAPALATARDGLVASAVAEAVIASMHHGGAFTAVEVPPV